MLRTTASPEPFSLTYYVRGGDLYFAPKRLEWLPAADKCLKSNLCSKAGIAWRDRASGRLVFIKLKATSLACHLESMPAGAEFIVQDANSMHEMKCQLKSTRQSYAQMLKDGCKQALSVSYDYEVDSDTLIIDLVNPFYCSAGHISSRWSGQFHTYHDDSDMIYRIMFTNASKHLEKMDPPIVAE